MRQIFWAGAALVLSAVAVPHAQAFSKDSLVYKKCADCHAVTDGKMARVEEIRTTPEEWRVIVDRMKRLYGMDLATGEMEKLLQELCATQILTPDEQAKVYYLSLQHNSQFLEGPQGPDQEHLFVNCVRCHSAGKIFSYRMTPEAWTKVRDFHHYVTPTVHMQMRETRWREQADKALAYLGREFAYGQAWKATDLKIEGAWTLLGHEAGKGDYRGQATLKSTGAGEYTVSGTLSYADGTTESFDGGATLYGGYALRTRTRHNGFLTRGAYIFSATEARGENHFEAPNFRVSSVRWIRSDATAKVLRVSPGFLVAGQETTVTIEGTNLPTVQAADVTFTGGVEVLSVSRAAPDAIAARVVFKGSAAADAAVAVKGATTASGVALKVAPQIDSIAVVPGTGRARLAAGPNYPAEGVQFEAVAYSGGVALGPVPAKFQLDEESTRHDDDDLRWVGGIGANGVYIPIGEYAPVPSRKYHSEASGWVKVVASYDNAGKALQAEAKLAVTMPDFIPRIR